MDENLNNTSGTTADSLNSPRPAQNHVGGAAMGGANQPRVVKKIKRPITHPTKAPMQFGPDGNPLPEGAAAGNQMRMVKKIKRPVKRPIMNPMGVAPQGSDVRAANPLGHDTGMANQAPMSYNNPAPISGFDMGAGNVDNEINNILDAQSLGADAFQLPQTTSQPQPQEQPRFVTDNDLQDNNSGASAFIQGDLFTKQAVGIVGIVMLIMGFIIAKLFFTEETIVRDGLQGVVMNPEVPKGRARCGIAEKTQGCVLYIMNPQRQDLRARDFYDLASQLTGRQRFVIETGNMRYSNTKISPGEIVQLNIPPLQ